jgi:hypothetical protein
MIVAVATWRGIISSGVFLPPHCTFSSRGFRVRVFAANHASLRCSSGSDTSDFNTRQAGGQEISLRQGRGGAGTSRRGSAALVASHSSHTVAGRVSGGIPSVAAPVGSETSGCASPALHSSTCVRSGGSPCWRDALSENPSCLPEHDTPPLQPIPHSHQLSASPSELTASPSEVVESPSELTSSVISSPPAHTYACPRHSSKLKIAAVEDMF